MDDIKNLNGGVSGDPGEAPRAVTVGTFDGLHRGHVAVLSRLVQQAFAAGLQPTMITFQPHPLQLINPEKAPLLLSDTAAKCHAAESLGIDVSLVPFTPALMRLTAEEWMDFLRQRLHVRMIVMGHDNTFGSDGRLMTFADYRRLGAEKGIEVIEAPKIEGISSSAIRRALADGDISAANDMLGRHYDIQGEIVHGRHIGRTIGFPTANLAVDPQRQLPAPGVYAGYTGLPDGKIHVAVVNIGRCPTVTDDGPVTVEASFPDYDGPDIYGEEIRILLPKRLRDERKFAGLGELRSQLKRDTDEALRYFSSQEQN